MLHAEKREGLVSVHTCLLCSKQQEKRTATFLRIDLLSTFLQTRKDRATLLSMGPHRLPFATVSSPNLAEFWIAHLQLTPF